MPIKVSELREAVDVLQKGIKYQESGIDCYGHVEIPQKGDGVFERNLHIKILIALAQSHIAAVEGQKKKCCCGEIETKDRAIKEIAQAIVALYAKEK